MRMWNVPPETMCRQHLLGEHLEMHMFVGAIIKGTSMQGYIENGMLDISRLASRHEELVIEMERRGMNHKSPFPEVPTNAWGVKPVDTRESLHELATRCLECARLQEEFNE